MFNSFQLFRFMRGEFNDYDKIKKQLKKAKKKLKELREHKVTLGIIKIDGEDYITYDGPFPHRLRVNGNFHPEGAPFGWGGPGEELSVDGCLHGGKIQECDDGWETVLVDPTEFKFSCKKGTVVLSDSDIIYEYNEEMEIMNSKQISVGVE